MLSYLVYVAAALVVMGYIAWTSEPHPWSPKRWVTPSHRVAEAGIVGFLMGLAYVLLMVTDARDEIYSEAANQSLGLAGLTVMGISAFGGIGLFIYLYSSREMEGTSAVQAVRSNPNRGPRRYAEL